MLVGKADHIMQWLCYSFIKDLYLEGNYMFLVLVIVLIADFCLSYLQFSLHTYYESIIFSKLRFMDECMTWVVHHCSVYSLFWWCCIIKVGFVSFKFFLEELDTGTIWKQSLLGNSSSFLLSLWMDDNRTRFFVFLSPHCFLCSEG